MVAGKLLRGVMVHVAAADPRVVLELTPRCEVLHGAGQP
jgi:hypothetical protein